jgi:hypothetical protein
MVLNRDNRLFIQFYLPFFPTDVRASGSAENHYFGALHSARKHCQPKRISQMLNTKDTVSI